MPRRADARRSRHVTVLRAVVTAAVFFTLFKAVMLVQVGAADYQTRIARLEGAGGAQMAGAWLLRPGPVTRGTAAVIGAALPGEGHGRDG